jgi:GTP-binding protein HflX
VHVRDLAHPESEAQRADVEDVLADLGVSTDKLDALLEARNKVDLMDADARAAMTAATRRTGDAVAISALTGEGVDALLDAVERGLSEARGPATARFALEDGRAAAWLYARGLVADRTEEDGRAVFELTVTDRELAQFVKEFPEATVARPEAFASHDGSDI